MTELSCDALAALPDVDGFLVGGASLKPKAFARIVASGRVKLAQSDVPTLLREVSGCLGWGEVQGQCMRDVKDKYTRVHLLSAFLRAKDPIDKRQRSELSQ